jgi:hypothetical protein
MNGSAKRYGRRSEEAGEFLQAHGYVLASYRHDAGQLDGSGSLWDDVVAFSPDGLRMVKERMPSARFIGVA